jgi:hypothetical protein
MAHTLVLGRIKRRCYAQSSATAVATVIDLDAIRFFGGDDGTDIQIAQAAALIQVNVDGTPGADSTARQDRAERPRRLGRLVLRSG